MLKQQEPLSYLITSGETTPQTTLISEEIERLLALVACAASERVSLIQLREKQLSTRILFQLAVEAVRLTRGTQTRLLVNDRADVACAARADGVHLTTRSLPARAIRRAFGPELLIGVSTHTLEEAHEARDEGADFAVFGPIFETPSKQVYGPPPGIEKLKEVAGALNPFPLLALGGVSHQNIPEILRAGAKGVAGIRLFGDEQSLMVTMKELRSYRANGVRARDSG